MFSSLSFRFHMRTAFQSVFVNALFVVITALGHLHRCCDSRTCHTERVTPGTVFENVGFDYVGELQMKYGKVCKATVVKAYICIIV